MMLSLFQDYVTNVSPETNTNPPLAHRFHALKLFFREKFHRPEKGELRVQTEITTRNLVINYDSVRTGRTFSALQTAEKSCW